MSVIAIETPFNISIDLSIAPFWRRLVAILLDSVILFVYGWVMDFFINKMDGGSGDVETLLQIFLNVLPVLLYHFLMETFFSGQSVGKKVMNIRVVNFNGNQASVSQYFLRMLFRAHIIGPLIAYILTLIFRLGNESWDESFLITLVMIWMFVSLGLFLFVLVSKYNQRLGDKIANTLVIETFAHADIHQTIFQDIDAQTYKVRYPEVMKLTDRDINGIRNLLDVKRITKDTEAYMQRITNRILQVLNIQTDQEPYDFLAQLLRDYNYLTSK